VSKPAANKNPTKKDLLQKLEMKVINYVDELMNKFRDSVNEAIEANQKRGFRNHMVVAKVLDSSNDRGNAIANLLIEKGIFSEEELNTAVATFQEKRLAEIEDVRRERQEVLDQHRARVEQETAQFEALARQEKVEQATVVGAASDPISSGRPEGAHPAEATVFGS
jgi:N-acetylglucosamine kinase-like BadF-type ATPase